MNLRRMITLVPRALAFRRPAQFVVLGLIVAGLWSAVGVDALAQYDRNRHGSPGMQQADRHNPFAQGGQSVYRNGGTTIISGNFGFGYGYPYFGYPYYGGLPYYGGAPYYGRVYEGYGSYYPYYNRHYYRGGSYMLPPIVLPPDLLYGPQALNRFLYGSNVNTNPPVVIQVNPATSAPAQPATNELGEPEWAREVTLAMRERAWRFIEVGDTAFLNRDYRTAGERYRAAARAAPRVVEAYLKQAQAMIALERYEDALEAYGRALALPPLWATANFTLDEQYGPEGAATKEKHLNQLAAAAEQDPNNPSLLLLVGMELFYDQQPERAVNFLRRAKELGGEAVELPAVDGAPADGDALPIPNPPPVGNDRRIF